MLELGRKPENTSLRDLGILDGKAHWNLTQKELIQISLRNEGAKKTSTGAIAVDTGEFTGRSPKDKFIVADQCPVRVRRQGSLPRTGESEKQSGVPIHS